MSLVRVFAERLLPLADWSAGRVLAEDHALAEQVVAIWNELMTRDVMAMNTNIAALAQPHRENRAARHRRH